MKPGNSERGFTLLELLVALVLLGFVMTGVAQGLRFGLRATERQEQLAAQRGDMDAVDRLLRRLVAQMDPGTSRTPPVVLGDAGALSFTTDLGAAAGALNTTIADVRISVQDGRLLLRWRPAPHVARTAAPAAFSDVVVLEGVEAIAFQYWGSVGDAPSAWQNQWRERALPRLVRIRLVFSPGSARRWPDIVAAPVRPDATQ